MYTSKVSWQGQSPCLNSEVLNTSLPSPVDMSYEKKSGTGNGNYTISPIISFLLPDPLLSLISSVLPHCVPYTSPPVSLSSAPWSHALSYKFLFAIKPHLLSPLSHPLLFSTLSECLRISQDLNVL